MPVRVFYESFRDASCEAWQSAIRFGISEGEHADNPIGFAAMAMVVVGMKLAFFHPEWAQAATRFFAAEAYDDIGPLADSITEMCPVHWRDEREAI